MHGTQQHAADEPGGNPVSSGSSSALWCRIWRTMRNVQGSMPTMLVLLVFSSKDACAACHQCTIL
jgi:hypothetical protein